MSCTSHKSVAQQSHGAGGCHVGHCREGIFPSLQKVLLASTAPDQRFKSSEDFAKIQILIQLVWVGAWDAVILANVQIIMLLVHGPHWEDSHHCEWINYGHFAGCMLGLRSGEGRTFHLQGVEKGLGWPGWNRVFRREEKKKGSHWLSYSGPKCQPQRHSLFLCRAGLPTKVRATLVRRWQTFSVEGRQ